MLGEVCPQKVLSVSDIAKNYTSYNKPIYRLLSFFVKPKEHWYVGFQALKGVSFHLKKGETVGIVGRNGSGKSTLLQIIVGTLSASSGSVKSQGRIAALLELGAGFNPEFSGRENVYLNGSIYGLSREQVDERFSEIEAFADIGNFIDQPVKTYSSGMFVRLAFAVIAHVDADILIIDEALAVGDALFSQKCMRFLEQFKERGSILFVSHDSGSVTRLCDRAIWLDAGKKIQEGTAKEVTEAYLEHLYSQQQEVRKSKPTHGKLKGDNRENVSLFRYAYDARTDLLNQSVLRNDVKIQPFNIKGDSFGTGLAKVIDVCIRDEEGRDLSYVVGGSKVVIDITFEAKADLEDIIVGFLLKNRQGQVLCGDNSFLALEDEKKLIEKDCCYSAQFGLTLPYLLADDYVLSVGVASGTQIEHVQHCWLHDALVITVLSDHLVHGMFGLPLGYCKIQESKR